MTPCMCIRHLESCGHHEPDPPFGACGFGGVDLCLSCYGQYEDVPEIYSEVEKMYHAAFCPRAAENESPKKKQKI